MSEWKKWVERNDTDHSIYVRLRDKRAYLGMCVVCGKRPISCAGHFLSRGNMATRWDDLNVFGWCSPCNFREMRDRKEKTKDFFRNVHIQIVGAAERERLESKARTIAKFSVADLKDINARIREQIVNVCGEAVALPRPRITQEPIL